MISGRCGIVILCLLITTATALAINGYEVFIEISKVYPKIVSGPYRTQHIKSYNLGLIDTSNIEREYRIVRNMMRLEWIDKKVTVIRADMKDADGSIGILYSQKIKGFYVRNLIVYDGTTETLRHELAHFFYDHASDVDRSEIIANLVEGL